MTDVVPEDFVSSFRPLSTRGAFVPSSPGGAAARAFEPLQFARPRSFNAGLSFGVVPVPSDAPAEEPEPAPQLNLEGAAGADVEPDEDTPAPAAPVVTSAAAKLRDAELEEALQRTERTAAELAEREAAREAEHRLLLADLESQKQKAKSTAERLGQLAGELVRARASLIEEVRASAGTLLLTGARRLAGEALRAQPGLLESLVSEIVHSMSADVVTVRVNPADVERLSATAGETIRVVADPGVQAGCVVYGDAGSVDASLDTGLGALAGEVSAWKRTA